MEPKHLAFLALAAVAVVVYSLDRRMHRRAKDIRTSWNCARCGVPLRPMESTSVRVAGAELAITARACVSCVRRDRRIWWATMGLIMLALAVTAFLTW